MSPRSSWRSFGATARRSRPRAHNETRVTSPSPGSSGARGKRPAGEARPGPGRRDRIAHPRRRRYAVGAPAATR
eukprot:scaffold6204_cov56-Phaeocystis_antarctica.AAC.4